MNAANVMAISPKADAAGKVQSTRIASKAGKALANDSQGSFDEALGKAGEEVTGKMAKSPAEAQGSTQGNVEAKEADIKDDMPEGTEAGLNSRQGREPKSGKAARDGDRSSTKMDAREGEKDSVAEQDTGSLDVQAVTLNFTAEGKAVLAMAEPQLQEENVPVREEPQLQEGIIRSGEELHQQPKTTEVNLQSLLPQSGEEAQKNKNFLAMLSGQQVKFPDEKEGNTSVQPMTQVQKTATMLEVQLSNHQLANKEGIQENVLMPSQDLRLNSLQGMNLNLLPNERLSNSSLANPVVFPEEGTGNPHLVNQTVGQETGQERWQNVYPEMERGSFSSGSQTVGQVSVDNIIEGHLDAQGNLNNPQFTVLNNGRERVEAKGMAPFEQSEETMPSMPAGRVNDSVTLQETGRVIISEGAMQMQNPQKKDSPSGNTLLAGVNITVEDETPVMPAPSMGVIISEGAMQMQNPQKKDSPSGNTLLTGVNITVEDDPPVMPAPSMDLQEDFQRGAYRQNQAAVPETEVVPDEEGELVSQLVEEAVGDKAPTQREPVQSGSNGPVSMFQQSLNESLTGARTANAVNQSQNAQEDFNVPQQIVEQARLLRRGEDTQMVIKLHPEHLGELTLKVSVSANGAVNASFHSDNAQVRAIIENTLVQLKQELNNQGLKVDNVDVYAGLTDGQLPQGEGQQAWQQNQGNNSNSRIRNLGNLEDYGEETENITAGAQNTIEAADGVDYRI